MTERVRARGTAWIQSGIAATLPWLIRRSLRGGLSGVWARGELTAVRPGTVLAPNHHSWWDAYLAWLVARRLGLPLAALMSDEQLARFPFFEAHGAIPRRRPRTLVRRLELGAVGIVFPEGRLRPAGQPGVLDPGAARLAEMAGAPLRPLAIRVVLRGAQHPEAYLSIGPVVEGHDELDAALRRELATLDRDLSETDPEAVPDGFEIWMAGARSPDRRARRFERWWR
ncbi:MAG: 1-acyl-sn-glycerol-3-phosphate acyltransferase [Trueperaceae bacterium]|nr:1-acyl-sn-glycerol-3-phosphate acyltransferase [Trueperaceae bacterium]